jgi:hypothetical protein
MKHRSRRWPAAAAAVALVLAVTASALAAAPPSGTYRGTLAPPRTDIKVSMKLAGTHLTQIKISDVPLYCSGGGKPIPTSFPSTHLSATHAFTAHTTNRIKVGPLKGQVGERLTMSGRFTHGKVSGTLKTVWPLAKSCGGRSAFSAKR